MLSDLHTYSDGGGRSGVFCEVDANLELVEEDGLLDVYGYLRKIRNSRPGLVETVVSICSKFIYERSNKDINPVFLSHVLYVLYINATHLCVHRIK